MCINYDMRKFSEWSIYGEQFRSVRKQRRGADLSVENVHLVDSNPFITRNFTICMNSLPKTQLHVWFCQVHVYL